MYLPSYRHHPCFQILHRAEHGLSHFRLFQVKCAQLMLIFAVGCLQTYHLSLSSVLIRARDGNQYGYACCTVWLDLGFVLHHYWWKVRCLPWFLWRQSLASAACSAWFGQVWAWTQLRTWSACSAWEGGSTQAPCAVASFLQRPSQHDNSFSLGSIGWGSKLYWLELVLCLLLI